MNIALGMPTTGTMRTETAMSIMMAMMHLNSRGGGNEVVLIAHQSCMIYTNREHTVADALKCRSDVLIFIDSDMAFPPDAFVKLLDHVENGRKVVGVNYYQRKFPPVSVLRMMPDDPLHADEHKELFEVMGLGCGLMAIDLSIIPQLEPPLFFYKPYVKGESLPMTEDMWFCERARMAGHKVWCDPTIDMKHIGAFAYSGPPKEIAT